MPNCRYQVVWRVAAILAAFFANSIASYAAAESAGDAAARHRHYDRDADCSVFDSEAIASEKASWDGPCERGLAEGHGTVVFLGNDGSTESIVADFHNGILANGHADIRWSDGRRYVGDVIAGRPSGHGVLTRASGDRTEGEWLDGQPVTPVRADNAAVQAGSVSRARQLLGNFLDTTLVGVDGSTVVFTEGQNRIIRTMTSPNGVVTKSDFVFLSERLGTVSTLGSGEHISGVFHVTENGVAIDYDDGSFELLAPSSDGLAQTFRSVDNEPLCAAWFLRSHAFTADERKAAVAAYAKRLGVASDFGGRDPNCPAMATNVDRPASPPPATIHRKVPHLPRRAASTVAAPATGAVAELQDIPVKPSTVHPIDTMPPSPVTGSASEVAVDEDVASKCLKVDSDGAYWGFRNHCSYSVQFSYCLMHGIDEATACATDHSAGVPGSVSPNGFGPLFVDSSLGELDAEHRFRWVGCRGGAGEVVAHLDSTEPVSGHCVRSARTLARGN